MLVASYEIGRFGLMRDKRREPDKVGSFRSHNSLNGFKLLVMDGPKPGQWRLIATRTTDTAHPDAPVGRQQGSGSLDAPNWRGGRTMILSSDPDDSYALTEYPDYLQSGRPDQTGNRRLLRAALSDRRRDAGLHLQQRRFRGVHRV